MGSWRVLTPQQVAAVARRFATLPYSWSADEKNQVAAELGWPVLAGSAESGAVMQTGFAPSNGFADLRVSGGAAGAIVVRVADPALGEDGEARDFRRDVFASTVRVVTEAVGAPVDRRPGSRPEVRWAARSGLIRVSADEAFVEIALLSPEYAQWLDSEDTRADDDADDGDDEEW